MGKGSKPRPVSKNYGESMDRMFGERCVKHHDQLKGQCTKCTQKTVYPCGLAQCEECEASGAKRVPARG